MNGQPFSIALASRRSTWSRLPRSYRARIVQDDYESAQVGTRSGDDFLKASGEIVRATHGFRRIGLFCTIAALLSVIGTHVFVLPGFAGLELFNHGLHAISRFSLLMYIWGAGALLITVTTVFRQQEQF